MENNSKHKWVKGIAENQWVRCLDCSHEYYVESFELTPHCPICGSTEWEETIYVEDSMDVEDLKRLL